MGDPLALLFEMSDLTNGTNLDLVGPFEIFVRDLVAMDGLKSSEILLVDEKGKN